MAAPSSSAVTGVASCLEFGPTQHSSSLLAIGGFNRLAIKRCVLKERELERVHNLAEALHSDETILDIPYNGGRIKSITWSAKSVVTEQPFIRLVTTGTDDKLQLFSSDAVDTNITEIGCHHDYVNDIAFNPLQDNILASVGDDLLCKVWNMETGQVISAFQLSSPGVSVCFHPHEPFQLLVAEQSGCIRLYNLDSELPILSLETPGVSIVQADWSMTNSMKVGAVGGANWYLWDISKSSLPYDTKTFCSGGVAMRFKWCSTSDVIFATLGIKGQVQIHHYDHQKVPVVCQLPVANDISWHPKLPIAAVAANNKVLFWGVEP